MVKVYSSAIILAPASEVWTIVGDYGGIGSWHPAISESRLRQGPAGDEVGACRECDLDGGAKLVERQTARSEEERFYTYAVTESPMPMKNYVGTIQIRPVTDSGDAFIEWYATFDPEPGAEDDLSRMIADVYRTGFESLKTRFASS